MIESLSEGSNIEEFIEENESVLIYFRADWCGACKAYVDILEEVEKNNSNLKIFKIDVEEYPELADDYSISSLPALIYFRGGEMVWKETGALPRRKIESMIQGGQD